ncbi:hypothetical protein ACH5RR_032898 [Cinchona calisaya]|uniref:Uncharacterized protein n=1 Tax=Cinchona calisaya TaxID=153742 RepID=A0ABD2YJH3_9GENT
MQNCPQLATVPSHFMSLKELHIYNSNHGLGIVTRVCSQLSTLTSLDISNVRELTEMQNGLFPNNPNLAALDIWDCLDLMQFLDSNSGGVRHLEAQSNQLHTSYCNTNKDDHLVGLVSIETLSVCLCSVLKSIPSVGDTDTLVPFEF